MNRAIPFVVAAAFMAISAVLALAGDALYSFGDLWSPAKVFGGAVLFLAAIALYPLLHGCFSRVGPRAPAALAASILLGAGLLLAESAATVARTSGTPGSAGQCLTLFSGWEGGSWAQDNLTHSRPWLRYVYRSVEDTCRVLRPQGVPETASTVAGSVAIYLRQTLINREPEVRRPLEREYGRIAQSLSASAQALEALRSRPEAGRRLASEGSEELEFVERADRSLGRTLFQALLRSSRRLENRYVELESRDRALLGSEIDPEIDLSRVSIERDMNRIDAIASRVAEGGRRD